MKTQIATEVFKLRTSRTPWIVLIAQFLLIVAGMSGLAIAELDFASPGAGRLLLLHAGLSSMLILVLGILAVTGEYRDGTITDTFLSTPRRSRVIGAKLVAYTGLGVVSGIITAATALIVGSVWFAAKGYSLDLGSADIWQTALGAALWMPLYAAIGVGVGALVRSMGLAIAIALAWIALVEGIAINLLGDLGRWLPGMAGFALDNAVMPKLLPQAVGGLVLAVYAVAFAVVASAVTMRSDVA